jgi:DNA-binding response OmpR family regulator
MKILLADDDPDLLEMVSYGLRRQGHLVVVASDGDEALRHWNNDEPDLMVVDVKMPGKSGLEVCKKVRELSEVPIIMISGAASESDIIAGLTAGGDDYVVKPFSLTHLLLRIRNVARRRESSIDGDFHGTIRLNDLVINPQFYSVQIGDSNVRLTRLEFRILYCLAANVGNVILTDRLADFAWGSSDEGDTALLKTHISRIRRKLGLTTGDNGQIKSVPGVGYVFNAATG